MKINKEVKDILLTRLLFSLGILLLIRIGTFLPVPGINHSDLAFYIERHSVAKNLISTFSGENTFVIGVFTLNIFPYINATIFIQLLLGFSPKLAKLQKEGDFNGRRSISRLTRFITLLWAIVQSIGVTLYLRQILFDWNYTLAAEIVLWLTTGSMIVLWLSELITEYGLGNGTSLLVYTNIISNLPNILKRLVLENSENLNFLSIVGISLLIFSSLYGIVFLQQGIRKIPLISSKQLNQFSGQDEINSYLPLRLNQAGVMPIILTTAFLVIPNYIVNLQIFQWLNFLSSFKIFYWIESTLNITGLSSLSTTSLLILAGVVLDLIREIDNIYYSNVYNNMYQ